MQSLVSILFGWLGVVIVLAVSSLVLSLLLRFTALGESTLEIVTLFISFLALFIGGLVAGLKAKQRGIIVGGVTSLLFTFMVFNYRFIGLEIGVSIVEVVHHAAFLLLAMIGGIIGVNLSSGEEAAQ